MKEKCALTIHSKFGVVFTSMTMCFRPVNRRYTSLRVRPVIKVGLLTFQVQSKVCAKIYKIQTKGNQAYMSSTCWYKVCQILHHGEGCDLQWVISRGVTDISSAKQSMVYKIQTKGNQAYYEQYLLIQSMPILHPGEGFDLQWVISKRFKMT